MLTWPYFRDHLLCNADATAAVGAGFMALAAEMRGGEAWKLREFIADGAADDPPMLALLQRNVRAAELLAAGLKEFRTALIEAGAKVED